MKYNVIITEQLERVVTVEAPTADEAENKIREMYHNEEIVLDSEDMGGMGAEFMVDDSVPDDFEVDVIV